MLELSLKYNDGSLEMPSNPRSWIKEQVKLWNFNSIGITRECCFRISEMPYHHDDAIDRMLVATALEEEMPLLSDTPEIQKYQYPSFGNHRLFPPQTSADKVSNC